MFCWQADLTFGSEFNQPLGKGVLPASLLQETFGWRFDQALGEGVLPAGLTRLTFDFVRPIAGRVCFASKFDTADVWSAFQPAGLRQLTFGWGFTRALGKGGVRTISCKGI